MKFGRILILLLFVAMALALGSKYFYPSTLIIFFSSATALILLSRFLGNATEHLSHYVGERFAGLLNVTLSNLAELIIIFVAVRSSQIQLVQAGIVGSIIGNILLVMGTSVLLGCKKHHTMKFNEDTGTLFINQLFLVGTILFLPTLFNNYIPQERQLNLSYVLSFILVGVYVYYYTLSFTDKRFCPVTEQAKMSLDGRWTKSFSSVVLILTAIGAFVMSELMIGEVDRIAHTLDISKMLIGFIIMPLLGNIAENMVAIFAARKGLVELSLSISVGSASQVGMIVAPCAVLFGVITGHPVILDFAGLPWGILILSLFGAFLTLRDNRWNINEGVTLLALYLSVVVAFIFAR